MVAKNSKISIKTISFTKLCNQINSRLRKQYVKKRKMLIKYSTRNIKWTSIKCKSTRNKILTLIINRMMLKKIRHPWWKFKEGINPNVHSNKNLEISIIKCHQAVFIINLLHRWYNLQAVSPQKLIINKFRLTRIKIKTLIRFFRIIINHHHNNNKKPEIIIIKIIIILKAS